MGLLALAQSSGIRLPAFAPPELWRGFYCVPLAHSKKKSAMDPVKVASRTCQKVNSCDGPAFRLDHLDCSKQPKQVALGRYGFLLFRDWNFAGYPGLSSGFSLLSWSPNLERISLKLCHQKRSRSSNLPKMTWSNTSSTKSCLLFIECLHSVRVGPPRDNQNLKGDSDPLL